MNYEKNVSVERMMPQQEGGQPVRSLFMHHGGGNDDLEQQSDKKDNGNGEPVNRPSTE